MVMITSLGHSFTSWRHAYVFARYIQYIGYVAFCKNSDDMNTFLPRAIFFFWENAEDFVFHFIENVEVCYTSLMVYIIV
jgi:hypothetical protein